MTSAEDVRRSVLYDAWAQGMGWEYVCDEGQQEWIRAFLAGSDDAVWMISRQRGKSFAALALADHIARTIPGAIIKYAAKTKESAEGIFVPNMKAVLETCPDDLQPKEESTGYSWANGSEVTWAGTDNQTFDRLRGPRAHLILLDESAFYPDLEKVEAALLPQLQTTGGKALYLSTPPESPAHPFAARWKAALAQGRARHDTIYGNPRLGPEGVRRYLQKEANRLGMSLEEFLQTTYFKREFKAEIVTEESRAAVPGWNEERHKALVHEHARPRFFDAYTSLDLGFGDPHGVLFGYLDFVASKLVIEDELELRHANTSVLADGDKAKNLLGIKDKERALWGDAKYEGKLRGLATMNDLPEWLRDAARPGAPAQPLMRVGDDDPLALADLHQKHGISFLPTRKDEKHLAVDAVDILIRSGRIIIHPRCRRLIAQLYSTVWNKQRTEWERTALDHGDLIDALIYMVRNVLWHVDPRPVNYGLKPENVWMPPAPDPMANLKKLAGLGPRKR